MARAAVVLYPVRWDEPFGMAAAEAQACGTPVVAFRRGALSEVIADGVTGFLVPPDDVQALPSMRSGGRPGFRVRPAATTPKAISTWNGAWTLTSGSTGRWSGAGDREVTGVHWLAGRVAVVTGASRGIGAATAAKP